MRIMVTRSYKSVLRPLKDAYRSRMRIMRSHIDKHNSAHAKTANIPMSPAQNLPAEILAQIFVECNPEDSRVVYLPSKRAGHYPWWLGHVCAHWRAALWHSSEVWSNISIKGRYRKPVAWDALDYILSRTTGLISITTIRGFSKYDKSRLASLFLSSSHRFRRMTLPPVAMKPLFDLAPGSLNYLEALHLLYAFNEPVPRSSYYSLQNPYQLFQGLRKLEIGGYHSIPPYFPHFPLSQLTDLVITGCRIIPTDAHYLLQECTSLIVANFSMNEVGPSAVAVYQANGKITSPLKCLTLSLCFNLDWGVFLEPLFLPSLTMFIKFENPLSIISFGLTFLRAMRSLITRSHCSLAFLSIPYDCMCVPNTDLSYPEFSGLLQLIPSLETLAVEPVIGPAFIGMAYELLPRLKTVHWRVRPEGLHAFLDLADDYITHVPVSRQFPTVCTITCDRYEGIGSAHTRYIQNYQRYMEAGIHIIMQDSSSPSRRVYTLTAANRYIEDMRRPNAV